MKLQYKIWDKPHREWVKPPYYINQYGDVGVKEIVFLSSDDFEIVVSTGLRDKNNKLIYEGDIIGIMEGNRLIGSVEYVNGKFQINMSIKGFSPKICGEWLKCYEVIGNIYDNKELTK